MCVSFGSPIPTKYTTNKPQKGFEVSLFLWGPFLESKKREEEEEDAYLVAVEMKTSVEAHT